MDLGLVGRSALITGGSKGIGFACADVLAAEGCAIKIAARSRADLERAVGELRQSHGLEAEIHACDLARVEEVERLAKACADIDILVNNAGAIPHGTIDEFDDLRLREAWALKLFGYFSLTRFIYRAMVRRGSGVIINIIGAAGEYPNPDYIAGTTANAGLMAFSRALGTASVDKGVRVIGINPGRIRTERQLKRLYSKAEQEFGDAARYTELPAAQEPFGQPQHVGDLVAFLASDRGGYISGTVITVDGGQFSRRKR